MSSRLRYIVRPCLKNKNSVLQPNLISSTLHCSVETQVYIADIFLLLRVIGYVFNISLSKFRLDGLSLHLKEVLPLSTHMHCPLHSLLSSLSCSSMSCVFH
jgi:multisubunit Na+/H+ antiporter MnhF subunit